MPTLLRQHPLLAFLVLALVVQVGSVWMSTHLIPEQWVKYPRIYAPAVLALGCAWLGFGRQRAVSLLGSLLHWRVPGWTLLFAAFYPLAIATLSLLLMRMFGIGNNVAFEFKSLQSPHLWLLVTQISIVEEIAWVGFMLYACARYWHYFSACLWTGLGWGIWYVPLVVAGIQVVPGLPIVPVLVNFMVIAAICGWVYSRSGSALVVALMQITTNMTSLVVPVLPSRVGESGYAIFVALKLLFAVALFVGFGPRPLFGRHGDRSSCTGFPTSSSPARSSPTSTSMV